MFTELGKMKVLLLFVILAFLVVAIVVLVACLGVFEPEPSTGTEVLASGLVVVGKSGWSSQLKTNSNQINNLQGDPWDMEGLLESKVNAQFYSVGASNCSEAQYKDAVAQTLDQIDVMIRVFEKYDTYFKPALSSHDISVARELYKIAGFLSVDGGYALDSRMSALRDYYRLGVRSIAIGGLCSTPWSTSSMDIENADKNLTDFGKLIVTEMNRLGILIDLTGSNKAIQLETIEISKAPVIFSSSSSSAITPNAMNVGDEVLQALCEKEGLIMVSLRADLCCSDTMDCSVDQVIEHLEHIAAFGKDKDCVGIGGDVSLSTVTYPQGLSNSKGYITLFEKLLETGNWTVEDLQKLEGKNFLRVMEKVEEVSRTMQQNQTLPDETLMPRSDMAEYDQACYSDSVEITQPQMNQKTLDAFVNFRESIRSFLSDEESTLFPSSIASFGEGTSDTPRTSPTFGEETSPTSSPTDSSEGGTSNIFSTDSTSTVETSSEPSSGGGSSATPSFSPSSSDDGSSTSGQTDSSGGRTSLTPGTIPESGGGSSSTPSAGEDTSFTASSSLTSGSETSPTFGSTSDSSGESPSSTVVTDRGTTVTPIPTPSTGVGTSGTYFTMPGFSSTTPSSHSTSSSPGNNYKIKLLTACLSLIIPILGANRNLFVSNS